MRHPYVKVMQNRGYTRPIKLTGAGGWSELLIHTQQCETPAHTAWVCPDRENYAVVEFEDGSICDGCFHRFDQAEPTRWSLS